VGFVDDEMVFVRTLSPARRRTRLASHLTAIIALSNKLGKVPKNDLKLNRSHYEEFSTRNELFQKRGSS
jgi:hypothetical protein